MALVRNGLSMKMKGRAGSFSFYSSKGRQVVRVAQNSTNYGESARRSEAQQVRRVKWANLVNFYKLMGQTLHGAFETKRANETDYNAFMRKNLPIATVALTKDMAAMGCVVAQKFVVSEGSLPSLKFRTKEIDEGEFFTCNIRMSASFTTQGKTVAAVTEEWLAKNSWLKVGMQVSLLLFMPSEDQETPRLTFERHEVTLSTEDTRDFSAVFGGVMIYSDENANVYFPEITIDTYGVMILSDSTSGQIKVSSETIVEGDDTNEIHNSTDEAVAKAMQSYGVDPTKFLESGDM